MTIELAVNNVMCLLVEGFNDTTDCRSQVINKNGNVLRSFQKVISEILGVTSVRIQNVTMVCTFFELESLVLTPKNISYIL